MKRVFALLLAVACATAGAEVFRHVGPDGEVSFSDTPAPGAEQVKMAPLQTISPPPPLPRGLVINSSPVGTKSAPSYARFAIVEPANGQSVRANDGNVKVGLSLQPALVPGHSIELIVDGEDGGKTLSGASLNFNLSDLPRGLHTLVARVKNGRGEKLVEAGPVSFHVLRVAVGG